MDSNEHLTVITNIPVFPLRKNRTYPACRSPGRCGRDL